MRYTITLILSVFCNLAFASFDLNSSKPTKMIGKETKYYRVLTQSTDFEQISNINDDDWISNKKEILNFGFTADSIFIRLDVTNSSSQTVLRYLQVQYPLLDFISVYQISANGDVLLLGETGDKKPFYKRFTFSPYFNFPIKLQGGDAATIYIICRSDGAVQLPLLLFSQQELIKSGQVSMLGYGLIYGALIIMFLYNLLFFFMLRDINHLFYSFYILCSIIYQSSLMGHTFPYLWPNSPLFTNIVIPLFISLTALFMILFTRNFLELKTRLPKLHFASHFIIGFCAFVALGSFVLPYNFSVKLATMLGFLVPLSLLIIGIFSLRNGVRSAKFYVIAWSLMLLGIIVLTLSKFRILPRTFIIERAQLFGSIVEVLFISFALGDKINFAKREQQLAEQKALKASKRTEGLWSISTDIIFMLDTDFKMLAVNKAVKNILKIAPEKMIGKPFTDLIFNENGEQDMLGEKLFFHTQLKKILSEKKTANYQARLKTENLIEPIDVTLSIELIQLDDDVELIAKATPRKIDSVVSNFVSQSGCYEIGNYLLAADEMCYFLTANLSRYLPPKEIIPIRVSLREIILNAIEHGNLGITFEQKTELTLADTYIEFLRERQKDPILSQKKVRIEFEINDRKIVYTITDQGSGFDHKSMMERAKNSSAAEEEQLLHGRGITMVLDTFDYVEYNALGNRVKLEKRISKLNLPKN